MRSPNAIRLAALLATALLGPVTASAQAKPPRPPKEGKPPGEVIITPGDKILNDAQRKKARYHMDFEKVEILDVIKFISQWTNKNFILPENVRGKISILGPSDVTAEEAYAAFLAALESNNLTITPTGRFLKIVPKKDSIRTSIPMYLDSSSQPPLDERMVTKFFRLHYNDADPIKNVIQQFITRDGEITPFPPDVLIISDNGLNMNRIDKLLTQLDQPGSQDEINVLQVDNAPVADVANLLTQIFQPAGGAQPGQKKGGISAMSAGKDAMPGAPQSPDGKQDGGTVSITKIIPDERTNKLIIIAGGKSFDRIKDLVKKLDVPTDSGGVHVYYLENSDAEDLAGTLQALASGQSSSGGKKRAGGAAPGAPVQPAGAAGSGTAALFSGEVKVTAEKSTNSLLIIASPSDYRNMVQVIQQLDVRRKQVFIEAAILEVKLNSENRFNIDVHGGYAIKDVQLPGTDSGIAPIIVGSEVSGAGKSLSIANLASLNGFLAGIQGPPIKVDGLSLALPSFGVVLNALQTDSDVNVISTPHLMTSDNEEAEIAVGSQVPFQTAAASGIGGLGGLGSLAGLGGLTGAGGTNGLSSSLLSGLGGLSGFGQGGFGGVIPVQRQPVELRLKIKPQVNESDFVKLEVDQQIEEISSVSQSLGPTTSKRSIKTTVVAKDQNTIVIGGLIQERTTRGETKTPFLGSIPILGKLFRAETTNKERVNLLLFLTPYVIRDQSDFRRIFERKMKERQEFVARFFGSSDEYRVAVDWERKKGPLANLRRTVKDEFQKAENGGTGAPGETIVTPDDNTKPPPPPPPPAEPPKPKAPENENPDETPVPPLDDQGGGGSDAAAAGNQ